MHDWQAVLKQRLVLAIAGEQADDVRREIAGHLEEMEEAACASGTAPTESEILASAGMHDWRRLGREIRKSKGESFMERAQRWLVPGTVTFLLAMMSDRLGYVLQVTPRWVWVRDTFFPTMPMHEPWTWKIVLLTVGLLPFCGAVGAALSWWAGGSAAERVRAALLPVMTLFALFVLVLPIEIVGQLYSGTFSQWASGGMRAFVLAVVSEVLLPGIALLLGALPLLGMQARHPAERMQGAAAH